MRGARGEKKARTWIRMDAGTIHEEGEGRPTEKWKESNEGKTWMVLGRHVDDFEMGETNESTDCERKERNMGSCRSHAKTWSGKGMGR